MEHTSKFKVYFTRILMGGVLVAAAASMVLTGNSDQVRSNLGNQNIVKIGSRTISAREFEMIYARRIAQSGMQDQQARQMGVPAMVLQSEIERETLLQAANKLGVRIDNQYVANQLKKQLDQVKLSGTPQEKLQIILNQQKISEHDFVNLMRGDFSINVLASTVTTGDLTVPNELLVTAYQAQKQKRAADLIDITLADIKKPALSDKDIKAYYEENKEAYRTSEKRDIAVLVLPQKLFAKDVTVSEADAKAYYEENKATFLTQERVQMEQVIVQDEAAAQKIIDAKPTSLASYTKDQAQYLKSDWYGKNSLPNEFSEKLFPAKPTKLVGPFKTSMGWHVLNVQSYEDAKPQSFADVKSTLERQLKDEKLDAQMTAFSDELDRMVSDESSLEAIADKYKLKTTAVANLQSKTLADQLKSSSLSKDVQSRIGEAVFTLQGDEISPLMDTSAGDYVLTQVTKVTPAAVPALETVKETVKANAQMQSEQKALMEKTEALIGAFDAKNPGKFDKAVKESGLTVKAVSAATKEDSEKTNGKEIANLLFSLDPTNALSYAQTPNKVTLVRLKDIVQSTETPDDKALASIRDTVKNDMIQELQQQFILAWQKKLKVNVNTALLQSAFGPQQNQDNAQ